MEAGIDGHTLRDAVRDVAPEALLVPRRILRRLVKQHAGLRRLGLRVPHDECLALPRAALARLRDAQGLSLPDAETIVLLPEPEPALLATHPPDVVLRRYWRLLYHARLDAHLHTALPDDAEMVGRIHALGQVELQEIRLVLNQERRVLPPGGDVAVWREFAALFLELRAFAPSQVAHWFPILEDPTRVQEIVCRDVDAAAVLAASRPTGAPAEPASPEPEPADEGRADEHRTSTAAAPSPVPRPGEDAEPRTSTARRPATPSPTPRAYEEHAEHRTSTARRPAIPSPVPRAEEHAEHRTSIAQRPAIPSPASRAEEHAEHRTSIAQRPAVPSPVSRADEGHAEHRTSTARRPATPSPVPRADEGHADEHRTSIALRPAIPSPAPRADEGPAEHGTSVRKRPAIPSPAPRADDGHAAEHRALTAQRPAIPPPAPRADTGHADELRTSALPTVAATDAHPPLTENLVAYAISAVRRDGAGAGAQALRALATALAATVGAPSSERWEAALRPALDRCDRWLRPEARLLYDVQRAAHEDGREVMSAHLVGWALSRGKTPIARPLPAQRRFRVLRALNRARRRVPGLLLSRADGARLVDALDQAVAATAAAIRAELRPGLAAALEEVGLEAASLPERVAREKLLDELLDRLVQRGFLSMGDVRDALSRGQLKVPDLTGAREAWTGDAMLRLDARLADLLAGVYRRGEVYMRGLQRVSALGFGTKSGRALTRFALLPFGGAFVILEGLQHMVGPLVKLAGGPELHFLTLPRLLVLGATLLLLIQSAVARSCAVWLLSGLWRVVRTVLVDGPRWALARPVVRRALASRPVRLVRRVLLRPLLLAGLVWWLFPVLGAPPTVNAIAGILLWLAFGLLINSRFGRLVEEATADALVTAWERLRHAIIPGLVRFVLDLFARLVNDLERLLYAVDERLRFRRGQGRVAFMAKAVAGVVWGAVTWVVRLYVNVLIEPQINPIKHFPVVTVSHKLTLPFAIPLTRALAEVLAPVLGSVLAGTIAGTTVLLMPGMFGFLAWELKENWRLFAANRPRTLRPAVVGSHGETLLRLMRPGFHSGTLPKLFGRLRRADRGLRGQRDTRAILVVRQQLHHVQDAIRAFVERELVALVRHAGIVGAPLRVGRVTLASNRIRVELWLDGNPHAALLALEEQSGHVVAAVARPGWLESLSDTEAARFAQALTGFYALGGVGFVREQVTEALPPGARYDLADRGLRVWLGDDTDPWFYRLRAKRIKPRRLRQGPPHAPVLDGREVRFAATPIPWSRWVEVWSKPGTTTPLVPGRVLPRARIAARLRAAVPRIRRAAAPATSA